MPFHGGLGLNQLASNVISSIGCESTFDFHHSSHATTTSPSHHHFESSSQTDVKPNPRLDVIGFGIIGYQYESNPSSWNAPPSSASTEKSHHHFESSQTDVKPNPRLDVVGLGNIGYQYESDPSSWNAPPSSASTETMSSCYSPYDHYDSEPPQSTRQSHYSEFINGQPCAYSPGSENDTSHVSELTAFSYQASTEYTSIPACTVFPETLCSDYEADPLHLSRHFERCPLLKKTMVASPRVLTASKNRRRPSKQGAKLYKCLRPECDGTFTARHNLISEPLRPQFAYLLHEL